MSPRVSAPDSREVDLPAWWDTAEAFVVLNEYKLTADRYEALTGEALAEDVGRLVIYEAGESLPEDLPTPEWWDAHGDTIAALDTQGERLDTPTAAEKHGDLDTEAALRTWRQENDLAGRRVSAFECETCGKVFSTRDALNGHMGSHADRSADEGEDTADGYDGDEAAEGVERTAGDETTPLTPETVEQADADALRDLARAHGLDPDCGEDRLRAELRDIADDEGDEGPTTRTAADLMGGENA